MSMKQKSVDIRLERDPRYVAAQARLTSLKEELNALGQERTRAEEGLSELVINAQSKINQEAAAMLSGETGAAALKREELQRTLGEVSHRIRVLHTAIEMQRGIVAALRGEIGKTIAGELLPQHRANVAAVFDALLQLNTALEQESDLREAMAERDIPYSAVIRPMPFSGMGTLRDNQSRVMRYMLECHEHGFIAADELPDVVREWIPVIAKPGPLLPRFDNDGWLNA